MNIPQKFQKLHWMESIQSVKDSIRFNSFENFRKHLENSLPQNSSYTRKRHTCSIIKWFFPERQLNNLLCKVWREYHDEGILKEIMRYQYLSVEPVVAAFVKNHLSPLQPGTKLPLNYFRKYVLNIFGDIKKDPVNRLSMASRDLGFIRRNRNIPIVQVLPEPKTSFLILTHHIFAPTIRTVSLEEIIVHPYWQYLGIRNQDRVRVILKEADARGLIAKYIKADQLEQITTKYTIEEILEMRARL